MEYPHIFFNSGFDSLKAEIIELEKKLKDISSKYCGPRFTMDHPGADSLSKSTSNHKPIVMTSGDLITTHEADGTITTQDLSHGMKTGNRASIPYMFDTNETDITDRIRVIANEHNMFVDTFLNNYDLRITPTVSSHHIKDEGVVFSRRVYFKSEFKIELVKKELND